MVTLGFAFSYSDLAVAGTAFPYPSMYLYVQGAGDVVYEAPDGSAQWFQGAQANMLIPIAATRILASGTVNGVSRTTTATNVFYCSSPNY